MGLKDDVGRFSVRQLLDLIVSSQVFLLDGVLQGVIGGQDYDDVKGVDLAEHLGEQRLIELFEEAGIVEDFREGDVVHFGGKLAHIVGNLGLLFELKLDLLKLLNLLEDGFFGFET